MAVDQLVPKPGRLRQAGEEAFSCSGSNLCVHMPPCFLEERAEEQMQIRNGPCCLVPAGYGRFFS